MRVLRAALALIFPLLLILRAGDRALGRFSVDLAGHLWMGWSLGQTPALRSPWIGFPEGVDLMPVLGGWLDLVLVGLLSQVFSLTVSYNLVLGLYLAVLAWGGATLARAFGVGPWVAALVGLLLQLDGFVMMHLAGGRPEQVGLGFVALALGLALRVWRGESAPWTAALAGATLLLVSWELSLLTALSLAFLTPWLIWSGVPEGAPRRWLRAALGCALLSGPWVLLFLSRATGIRSLDEGDFALNTALRASVGLLGWFGWSSARPGNALLLSLLLLPWVCRVEDRKLCWGGLLGLLVTLSLATGPSPGLWAPGPLPAVSWAPFNWMQSLPVLGWFHWPDRLLCVWGLLCVVSLGLLMNRIVLSNIKYKFILNTIIYCGVLCDSITVLHHNGLPARGEYELPARPAALALAQRPEPGAVLDLPIQPERVQHLQYMLEQLSHRRPILFNMVLGHLEAADLRERVAEDPLLSWFGQLMDKKAPAPRVFTAADLHGLRELGFDFVVIHRRGWPTARWRLGYQALSQSLGEPALRDRDEWICWPLDSAGPEAPLDHP